MVIFLGGLRFLVVFLRVVYWGHCFLLYCNDILAKIYIYADDAKLYNHVRDSGDVSILQREIKNIKGWADE